jgi:hypothetical protein
MKILEPVVMEPIELESCWWPDPSIDHDASDIGHWCETASMDRIVQTGPEPIGKLRMRGLTERELAQLPDPSKPSANVQRFYEATRYGLIHCSFAPLRREHHDGVPGLQDRTLDLLQRYQADIPIGRAWRTMAQAINVTMEEDQDGVDTLLATSLPIWVGTHILALTFRARRSVT